MSFSFGSSNFEVLCIPQFLMLAKRVWPGMGQVAACFGQMNSSMPLLGQVKFGRGGVKSSVIQGSLANIAFA